MATISTLSNYCVHSITAHLFYSTTLLAYFALFFYEADENKYLHLQIYPIDLNKGSFLSDSLMQLKKIFQITILSRKFKFSAHNNKQYTYSAQDGDMEYFFEPHWIFWQKATFSTAIIKLSGGISARFAKRWLTVHNSFFHSLYKKVKEEIDHESNLEQQPVDSKNHEPLLSLDGLRLG